MGGDIEGGRGLVEEFFVVGGEVEIGGRASCDRRHKIG